MPSNVMIIYLIIFQKHFPIAELPKQIQAFMALKVEISESL